MAINVGKANLVEHLELILSLRGSYPIVAIDTEFPGFIRDTPRDATEEERYNDVKHNVDNMHLIQLGVALFDEGGNTPWPGCCWQFNFSDFDPDVDASSPDSIELLTQSGHDFQQYRRHGIDARRCAYLVCVKLFCQPYSSKYVTFHGLYDVAFVIKMITRAPLPNTLNEFSDLVLVEPRRLVRGEMDLKMGIGAKVTVVVVGKYKSEAFEKFRKYKNKVENQTRKSIKIFDQIEELNGVSERRNCTLLDIVRLMINFADLPVSFYGYTLKIVDYLLNRIPTKSVVSTPYEIWKGKKLDLKVVKI
ncbi:probable CCR4-associated factor 1 homolog 11 [Musa acuminata AAA Group]|uniref:probable CCR4-associated factor 1 homolog 11 n=1 Tax=Musa acuminata AAA Group TaxID=214697 RepID=UPI0031DC5026